MLNSKYLKPFNCVQIKLLVWAVLETTLLFANKLLIKGGARGVIVIVVGNEHGDTSSNPGRDWLHFT